MNKSNSNSYQQSKELLQEILRILKIDSISKVNEIVITNLIEFKRFIKPKIQEVKCYEWHSIKSTKSEIHI